MNHSDNLTEFATALSKAQGSIKGALKDSANPFFKSKYADLSSVVDAIKEAFTANGLSYIQTTEPSDKNEVRVGTILLHSSGQWFDCGILAVPVAKADAQGFGSALTYARRYGLSAATGVAPEDDDGNAASKAMPKKAKDEPEREPEDTTWTEEDMANLHSMLDVFSDLLGVIGMPEVEIGLRCQYYKDFKNQIPFKTAVNRLATATAAAEAKAKKKLAEAK